MVIMKIEDISRKKVKHCKRRSGSKAGLSTFAKNSCPNNCNKPRNFNVSNNINNSEKISGPEEKCEATILLQSEEGNSCVVCDAYAWCVTQSRRHFRTVEGGPMTMGGAMSSSCSSSQVAPRICDLFCQSAPIYSSLQSYSTLQLYSTTFSTNLLPATSSLPPAHPPLAPLTTQPPTFLLLQTKSSLCLIERLYFQMLTQKS